MYYTTPLIALTESELDRTPRVRRPLGFSPDLRFGLVTGNRTVSRTQPVLVVVPREIPSTRLASTLKKVFVRDVSCVVMDEFHVRFNDLERGIVVGIDTRLLPRASDLFVASAHGRKLARVHRHGCCLFAGRNLQLVQGPSERSRCNTSGSKTDCLRFFRKRSPDGTTVARRTPALMFLFLFARSVGGRTAENASKANR